MFRKISGVKPSFGFINGLALAAAWKSRCTPTTARSSTRCRPWACRGHAGPHPRLGRLPAPNLIGPANAAKVFIENPLNNGKVLKGTQVSDLGIADVAFNGADYLEQSLVGRQGAHR